MGHGIMAMIRRHSFLLFTATRLFLFVCLCVIGIRIPDLAIYFSRLVLQDEPYSASMLIQLWSLRAVNAERKGKGSRVAGVNCWMPCGLSS